MPMSVFAEELPSDSNSNNIEIESWVDNTDGNIQDELYYNSSLEMDEPAINEQNLLDDVYDENIDTEQWVNDAELQTSEIYDLEQQMRDIARLVEEAERLAREQANLFGGTPQQAMQGRATVTENFSGGDGTASNPFVISTVADLQRLATLVNAGDSNFNDRHYILANDIDLSSIANWTPIGFTHSVPFRGVFDGNGHVISNLRITNIPNTWGSARLGLFGVLKNATIVNLGVSSNVSINLPSSAIEVVTGLIAASADESSILSSHSSGSVSVRAPGINFVGGIVGTTLLSRIENCFSTANVTAESGTTVADFGVGSTPSAGGIVGWNNGQTIVRNTYATGAITATPRPGDSTGGGGVAGGIIGWAGGLSVEYNVALNPTIANASLRGRVIGIHMGYNGPNYALDTMAATGIGGGPWLGGSVINQSNGADVTQARSREASFWTDTLGWCDTNIWYISNGTLPTLRVYTQQTTPPPVEELRSFTLEALGNSNYQTTGVVNSLDEIVFELTSVEFAHFQDSMGWLRGNLSYVDGTSNTLMFYIPPFAGPDNGLWPVSVGDEVGFDDGHYVSLPNSSKQYRLIINITDVIPKPIRSITIGNANTHVTGLVNTDGEIVFEMTADQFSQLSDHANWLRGTLLDFDADSNTLLFYVPPYEGPVNGFWPVEIGDNVGFDNGHYVALPNSKERYRLVIIIVQAQDTIRNFTIERNGVQATGIANASDEIVFEVTAAMFAELSDDMGWLRAIITGIDADSNTLRFQNTYGYWDMGIGREPGFYNGHSVSIPGAGRLYTLIIRIV